LNYLIDTNIISEIISKQPNKQVLDFFNHISDTNIYLSVITIGEIRYGIDRLVASKRKIQLEEWFQDLLQKYQHNIITIDINSMLIWADINATNKSQGITLSIMDSLIASSALSHNLTLVTRNTKDFYNISSLKIINPFEGI
jgi:predicted nucleic acid-binding protein